MKDRNNQEDEIWVTLKQGGDTYTRYEVSNYGRVWDLKNDKEVSQVETGKPLYKYVNLYKDSGQRVLRRVHNIMGWSFLGEPKDKSYTVDHIDRDKFNNRLSNLRWLCKKGQMDNRDYTLVLNCGTPITKMFELRCITAYKDKQFIYSYISKGEDFESSVSKLEAYKKYGCLWNSKVNITEDKTLPYHILADNGFITQYLYESFRKSKVIYFKDYLEGKVNSIPDNINQGYEFKGLWYPSLKLLHREQHLYPNYCSFDSFKSKYQECKDLEEALSFTTSGVLIDGVVMSQKDHCDRLNLSHARIEGLMYKSGLIFEEAIKVPVERVRKHHINGKTKSNKEWYETFNIPCRSANSWLCDSKYKSRTFRDVLEKFNIDTSYMEIYPCDGDVVQYNKPL